MPAPTPVDFLNFERELCKRSLAKFSQRAWRVLEPAAELKWGWALDAICQHLEAVTDGRINRLLMNVPPGSMKSLLTGVIWPAWEWGPRGMPWKRYVGTAHEEQLAIRDSRRCRDLIKSEWYQELWPIDLLADLDGKREFGNTKKGIRQARSFTSMTGVRGDCLLGHSKVMTEHGIQTIENLVICAYSGNVLSYDHDSKQLVYRPVQAVARRSSKDFYRVHFADGGMVECTGDHQIHTARGYVAARLLSEGDSCLRLLRGDCHSGSGGYEEARQTRVEVCNLLQPMHPDDDEYRCWENGAVLHCVRGQDSQKQTPVLGGLQAGSAKSQRTQKTQANGDVHLPCVQCGKPDHQPIQSAQVLLNDVQGQAPLAINDRASESTMERWDRCSSIRQGCPERIPDCSGASDGNGWRQVCSVQLNQEPALPSHRPRLNQQCAPEPCDDVQAMPPSASCDRSFITQSIAVSLVERVCKEADVYDIQVAGTHCFFADGILVHNCIILDDPISADSANSAAKIEAARIAFTETLPTRVNSEKSAIVVIMQRLHEKDVSGVILEMGLPYTHLCIPMRFDPAHRCTTSIGWTDPRTEAGELMFPERFGEAQVKELERTLGSYGSAGQLQQRPAPRGGGILRLEWFRYWRNLPPQLEFRVITADTAQKTGEANDYSVLQCWGRSTVGQAVMLDQIRGKWESPELIIKTRAFWLKHLNDALPVYQKATLRGLYVEDKVSGTGLIQTLRREGVAVGPVQRNKDKISRGHDAAPFIESGNCLLPEDAPWLSDFLAEVESFPSGAHDDQLDPMLDAINLVQRIPASGVKTVVPIATVKRW